MKIELSPEGKVVKMHPCSHRFFKEISTTGVNGWKGIAYNGIKNLRAGTVNEISKIGRK